MSRLAAIVLVLCAVTASAADDEVRVLRHGKEVSPLSNPGFISNVVALLQSCSVDSTGYAATPVAWEEALSAPSYVYVKLSTPREFQLARSLRTVDEILVPLPIGKWPAHLFVRYHGVVLSFTKYRPEALKRVVWEAPLDFEFEPPYNGLSWVSAN